MQVQNFLLVLPVTQLLLLQKCTTAGVLAHTAGAAELLPAVIQYHDTSEAFRATGGTASNSVP